MLIFCMKLKMILLDQKKMYVHLKYPIPIYNNATTWANIKRRFYESRTTPYANINITKTDLSISRALQ